MLANVKESKPYEQASKYLICDNDRKFGSCFARVAITGSIFHEYLAEPYFFPTLSGFQPNEEEDASRLQEYGVVNWPKERRKLSAFLLKRANFHLLPYLLGGATFFDGSFVLKAIKEK